MFEAFVCERFFTRNATDTVYALKHGRGVSTARNEKCAATVDRLHWYGCGHLCIQYVCDKNEMGHLRLNSGSVRYCYAVSMMAVHSSHHPSVEGKKI